MFHSIPRSGPVFAFLIFGVLHVTANGQESENKKLEVKISNKSGSERTFVPLSFPIPKNIQADSKHGDAVLTVAGERIPAQRVTDSAGQEVVWWIQPRLAPNQELTGTISFHKIEMTSPSFKWATQTLDSSRLEWNGKPVLEYVSTPHDPKHHEETKKPYHHVFDPSTGARITKGLGGLWPHHRGIFFGYRKCDVDGKSWDTWHCNKGEYETNIKTLASWAGPVFGGHRTLIDWDDPAGKAFAKETREVNVIARDEKSMFVDFTSTVTACDKKVKLDGDRKHAGVQFRAAQSVAENDKLTRFLRPEKWGDIAAEKELPDNRVKDLPWDAMTFPIEGKKVTVVYLRSTKNPLHPQYDERLYGRFGEFVPYNLEAGKSITLRYRFWIVSGDVPTKQAIEQRWSDFNDPPKVSQ